MRAAKREVDVSRIFPPREDLGPTVSKSYRLPKRIVEKLEEIEEATGYGGTEVIIHLLRFAIQEWEAEASREAKVKR